MLHCPGRRHRARAALLRGFVRILQVDFREFLYRKVGEYVWCWHALSASRREASCYGRVLPLAGAAR